MLENRWAGSENSWSGDFFHSKNNAIDLQNALKQLGVNNQTRITEGLVLLIKLNEDIFSEVRFEADNINCYIRNIKGNYLIEANININKTDKIHNSGVQYYQKNDNFPMDNGLPIAECGETDLTKILPNALNELVEFINFYKNTWVCKYCGNSNRDSDMKCPNCGAIRT